MLTQERLRELLNYDPATGIFTWRMSKGNSRPGDIAGAEGDGYLFIGIDYKVYRCHRLAWLYMTGEWPPDQIDHIDLNRKNNKWENLRLADTSQNKSNMRKRSDNSSGYKGVYWYKQTNRWAAQIGCRGKRKTIGYFKTKEDAHAAYLNAAKTLHGEFARAQ